MAQPNVIEIPDIDLQVECETDDYFEAYDVAMSDSSLSQMLASELAEKSAENRSSSPTAPKLTLAGLIWIKPANTNR